MDAVSQHGGRSRPPWLQSVAACAGIAVFVGLSIFVGVRFWWGRDPALAILTIGAELVAFAGLGVTMWQWKRNRALGFGGGVVTIIAAAWCGFTMFQNIQAESRQEAIDVAKERPAYFFAENAARTAERLLNERLTRPNPRPTCACPQTIAQWEAAEAASIDRLRNERDAAVRQMEAAIPEPEMDWLALARGIGVEIAKLFGFVVFIVSLAPPRRKRNDKLVEVTTIPQPGQPFEVVEGGLATSPPTIAPPTQPPAQPKPQPRWLRLKPLENMAAGLIAAHATQPAPNHFATNSTTPANQPVETVVERDAAPIRWDKLGDVAREMSVSMSERRIAAQMTTRYGEKISRHQVRIWLGRESSHA